MTPMAAAAVGALISGVAMYAVGARAQQDSAFAELPAVVETVDGRYVQVAGARTLGTALQPAAAPAVVRTVAPARTTVRTAAPQRTVYRTAPAAQERVVVERATEPRRSRTKTALIIGGSTASGAGVGGLLGGKKGALVGAAIGGGAASIYEATRRR